MAVGVRRPRVNASRAPMAKTKAEATGYAAKVTCTGRLIDWVERAGVTR